MVVGRLGPLLARFPISAPRTSVAGPAADEKRVGVAVLSVQLIEEIRVVSVALASGSNQSPSISMEPSTVMFG